MMDEGRRWALEVFGAYGPRIREEIPQLVAAEHEASSDAQEASGHRSKGVYGEYWRGILERFEKLGDLPGAALVRPGKAPYKVPVVNGVALFPWRPGSNLDAGLASTPFGTSASRIALSNIAPPCIQGSLDIDVPDAALTEEELSFLDTCQTITEDPRVTSGRLVLIAIGSSTRGLSSLHWGEVKLAPNKCLEWVGFNEGLLSLPTSRPVSTSPTRTFTSGAVPNKFPAAAAQEAGRRHDE